jgi:hypothetical protein
MKIVFPDNFSFLFVLTLLRMIAAGLNRKEKEDHQEEKFLS